MAWEQIKFCARKKKLEFIKKASLHFCSFFLSDTMIQVASSFSTEPSLDVVLSSIPARIYEAVHFLQENMDTFMAKVRRLTLSQHLLNCSGSILYLYVYMCVYICVCVYMCVYIYTHIYIYIYMYCGNQESKHPHSLKHLCMATSSGSF